MFAPRPLSDLYAQIETPLGAIGFDPSDGYARPYYPPRPAKVSITLVLDGAVDPFRTWDPDLDRLMISADDPVLFARRSL